ncbi:MAG: hypothetical protein ACT4NL_13630 [Pseudomarimonas sp.]
MSLPPPRFITAAGPVNRRTARRSSIPATPSPVEQIRIEAARTRIQLGAPLSQQVRRRPGHARFERKHVLALLLTAAVLALLFLAGVQKSWPSLAFGVAMLALAGLVLRSRREAEFAAVPTAWLPESALLAFDNVLTTLAGEIDPPHRELLCEIKSAVIGIANTATSHISDEHFNADDRHYVIECMRRYVPDSLTAYLAIPKAQREVPLATPKTSAVDMLRLQLTQLRDELRLREAQAARSATTNLLRQQRFLDSKRSIS